MKKSFQIWLDAARPKTLPLALVSILTGSALAFSSGYFSLPVCLFALLTATLLQILSNLANDYGDAIKGTDNEARLGPTRALQSGNVTLKDMKLAIVINIVLTIVAGLALIFYALSNLQSILLFLGLGVLAIVAAIAYTVGNQPYGYIGLGDIAVLIFFGLLGVSGTFFLHTGYIEWLSLLPSLGCGLLAVAVLNVNNMRDIDNDANCGKRTIAVRLGLKKAKQYHLILLCVAFIAYMSYLMIQPHSYWLNIPFFLGIIILIKHGKAVWGIQEPIQVAPMMATIVKCSVMINILFVGIVVVQTIMS